MSTVTEYEAELAAKLEGAPYSMLRTPRSDLRDDLDYLETAAARYYQLVTLKSGVAEIDSNQRGRIVGTQVIVAVRLDSQNAERATRRAQWENFVEDMMAREFWEDLATVYRLNADTLTLTVAREANVLTYTFTLENVLQP